MKKLILLSITMSFCILVSAQKIKEVDEFNIITVTKQDYKKYKTGFDVKNLITGFGEFSIGDDLIIGYPSEPNNVSRSSATNRQTTDFSFVAVNKFSIMNAMAAVYFTTSDSNTEIVIERIRVYKPSMGSPANIVIDFTRKDGARIAMGKFGSVFNFERAVSLGEIINPNAPLTREQAIAKLKEAKDLLELEMMSKEEFDNLKSELAPIIRGN